MTNLEQFIQSHADWRELLAAAPYNIKIKDEGIYTILRYNQIAANTDWFNPIVRECRGIIINNQTLSVVCHAFDRFYNYSEPYADEIDWASATAMEKVDGSIIKVWADGNQFHISTNGAIDAYDVDITSFVGGKGKTTFGDKAMLIIAEKPIYNFAPTLVNGDTHIFELIGPENKVVIDYPEDNLVYLGSRNIETNEEYQNEILAKYFDTPDTYKISGLTVDQILTMVDGMNGQEGIVVKDKYNHRVKIKNPEYLLKHRSMKNFTDLDVIKIVMSGETSEWAATIPQLKERVETMTKVYNDEMTYFGKTTEKNEGLSDKEFALKFKDDNGAAILFNMRKGRLITPQMFLKYYLTKREHIDNL